MPKSAKKKKEKTADFAKPKLKLGKGKRPASNAVDTTFKARSIALPQQSIVSVKNTSAPTTRRKQTVDDLLAQLKHYSANVRKDALQGLHELLGEHRSLIDSTLLSLINSCARLIGDEDAGVRRSLHLFLSWLLHNIPQDHLAPHASTLLLFAASAQTSIFPEIRIDSIRIIDLLLECVPENVVNGCMDVSYSDSSHSRHGRKILEGYLGLLNVGAKFSEDGTKGAGPSNSAPGPSSSSGTVMLSPASKSIVLKSLSKFLLHATSSDPGNIDSSERTADDPIPLWYLSNSFSSPQAFESYAKQMTPHRTSRTSRRDIRVFGSDNTTENDSCDFVGSFPLFTDFDKSNDVDLSDLDRVLADIEGLSTAESATDDLEIAKMRLASSLCRTLYPVLVSAFLDCAPSVFSPAQACPEAELELVTAILEITQSLYGPLLRDKGNRYLQRHDAQGELGALLGHMAAYFPFGENSMSTQDMKTEAALQNMNLMYCELFSLCTLASDLDPQQVEGADGPAGKRRRLDKSGSKINRAGAQSSIAAAAKQAIRVQEYVVRRLRGSGSINSVPGARPMGLTAQTYVALLPTLWWLLCRPALEDSDGHQVLSAILQHAMKAGSSSGVKMPATEFVARLVQLQSEALYTGEFRIGPTSPEEIRTLLREWIIHLPKALWELADKNATVTEFILLFLLRLLQRRTWLNDMEILSSIRSRLCPFFMIQHPSRGEILGPYAKLKCPSGGAESKTPLNPLKRLALDVVAILLSSKLLSTSVPGRPLLRPGYRSINEETGTSRSNQEADELSKTALRKVVEKAVTGTDEEAYWHGVSVL